MAKVWSKKVDLLPKCELKNFCGQIMNTQNYSIQWLVFIIYNDNDVLLQSTHDQSSGFL